MMPKALFLDRDGIITSPINGEAPQKPKHLQIITEIIPVIKKAQKYGYLTIVISNQPDIALGKIDEETLEKLELHFHEVLKERNIDITAIFYCHHHENGINKKYSIDCNCKKPKPGLLLKAQKQFGINMNSSFMLGDRASDIKAGKNAGTKTILYDPLNTQTSYLKLLDVQPDYKINNLKEVTDIICKP